MKIFSMTVDKKPTECFLCPIERCGVRMTKDKCGKVVHRKLQGGWETDAKIPDERCIIHEIGGD